MQQCTNIYSGCFEVTHILNLFSVAIMSTVSGIWGGYEKAQILRVLTELINAQWKRYKEVSGHRVRREKGLQWHLSSPVHCELHWASAVNKLNDAHWKRDIWAGAAMNVVTQRAADSHEALRTDQLTVTRKSSREGKSNHSSAWKSTSPLCPSGYCKSTTVKSVDIQNAPFTAPVCCSCQVRLASKLTWH